jgi:ComF family protein
MENEAPNSQLPESKTQMLTRSLSLFYDSALAVVYPQACHVCGASVESRADGFACGKCWSETRIFTEAQAICWKCGKVSGAGVPDEQRELLRCLSCDEFCFTAARACGIYEKALRASVLSLKRQPHLPRRLAEVLVSAAKRVPLDHCTRIIPVPLHPERERARGFNQAEIIGQEVSKRIGLPLDHVSLFRTVHTDRHRAGMDAKARRETVEDAFAVRYPHLIAGESILLVDDVLTTGATASSCASALINAGAKEVFVLTIARPLDY